MLWQTRLGGPEEDQCGDAVVLSDGGLVVVGGSDSFGNTDPDNPGWDGWVVRLDETGAVVWQVSVGTGVYDYLTGVVETGDGGLVVAGYYEHPEEYGVLLVKLSGAGALEWFSTYRGDGYPQVMGLSLVANEIYLAVRQQRYGFPVVYPAVNLMKFTSGGSLVWKKRYQAGETLMARGLVEHPDGGVTVVGQFNETYNGQSQAWVARVDDGGDVAWSKLFPLGEGMASYGTATTVGPATSEELVIAGSAGGEEPYRAFVTRISRDGDPLWQTELVPSGGWTRFFPTRVEGRVDGRIAAAGWVEDDSGDLDGYLTTLTTNGTIADACSFYNPVGVLVPNPLSLAVDTSKLVKNFRLVTTRPSPADPQSIDEEAGDPCLDLDSDEVLDTTDTNDLRRL